MASVGFRPLDGESISKLGLNVSLVTARILLVSVP